VTNDIDLELKQIFDQRLAAYTPPVRSPRARLRVAVLAAVATVIIAAGIVAADVTRAEASAGVSCPNVMTKLQIWAESIKLPGPEAAAKVSVLKQIADENGCVASDAQPLPIVPKPQGKP
jgi:hypothetical protein